MILGLDCSTVVCGWAMFDGISILDAGFIDISKIDTNKEKVIHILKTLVPLPHMENLKEIKLEAALSGFMRGRTSQQVVIKLARFNAVLEYILGEQLKVPVTLVGANTARKKVLGKAFIKGMPAKEYVERELPKKIPEIQKYYMLNKIGNYDKRNEDLRDAIIISMS
jgi:Holliday junction resolvasome RuvABC endonuclease subunit